MSSKLRDKRRAPPSEAAEDAAEQSENDNVASERSSTLSGPKALTPEAAPFPWGLVWAGLVIAVLFILRRYLRAMFPVLLLFSVFVPLLWYLWRQYKYRDLWDVYRDYDELITLLHSKGLYTYGSSVDQSMRHIMAARDKAEGLLSVLERADLPGQTARIEALERQLAEVTDAEKRVSLTLKIADAQKTLEAYRRAEAFLGRYAEGKKHLAEQFRNLRLKLEVPVVDPVSPSGPRVDEIDEMIQQLRRLDSTYESVDGQGQTSQPPQEFEKP
ncbi:MAG TPA: hypothetical protein PKO06_14920 [Candidatus Ozemobacteraceae bacterium]|nr:hypothetical protein [Candidatus Ozemobacteraceae bacterium]